MMMMMKKFSKIIKNKSDIIKLIKALKEENKSFKEIEENTIKQVQELNKTLKGVQEDIIKQEKEMNKTVQDLKIEIEAIRKMQSQAFLERDNLGKRTGTTGTSITSKVQEVEERIPRTEDIIEETDTSVKENAKSKIF